MNLPRSRVSLITLMAAWGLAALPELPPPRRDPKEQPLEPGEDAQRALRRAEQRAEMERDAAEQSRLVASWHARESEVAAGFRAERIAKKKALAEKVAARRAAKLARAQAG